MKTVALTGSHVAVGKTALGTFLARRFDRVAALCVTSLHRDSLAPSAKHIDPFDLDVLAEEERHAELDAALGREPLHASQAFELVDAPKDLLVKGSDTRGYWDAGADPVWWLKAHPQAVVNGVNWVCELLAGEAAQASGAVPDILLIESDGFVEQGGAADVTLAVVPNGHEGLSEEGLARVVHADAFVLSKRRPGELRTPFLDDERIPSSKLDVPMFGFNRDENNLAPDDRDSLVQWLRRRLDVTPVVTSDGTLIG